MSFFSGHHYASIYLSSRNNKHIFLWIVAVSSLQKNLQCHTQMNQELYKDTATETRK